MSAPRSRKFLWLAALAVSCGVLFTPLPAPTPAAGSRSLAVRLFGPIAALAASAQWVRADLALRSGRVELFLARAQTAIALAPAAAEGWHYLAWQQAYVLGSPEREPDPVSRLAWIRAGLATAAEGERAASDPGDLACLAGLIMLKVALIDADLPWPGGLPAVAEAAARHFERAASLGFEPQWAKSMADSARHAGH